MGVEAMLMVLFLIGVCFFGSKRRHF